MQNALRQDQDPRDQSFPSVPAFLTYLIDDSREPWVDMTAEQDGEPRRQGDYGTYEIDIHDARAVTPAPDLDREGFALFGHKTAFTGFADDSVIAAAYYQETEALLREVLGARRVIAFDHNRRIEDPASRAAAGQRAPVRRVHNDYTYDSAPQRVRDLLGNAEAERELAGRFAVVNVWRPLREPLLSAPLALVDAQTMAPEDLVINRLIYADRVGETYAAKFSPRHRWYYFPKMTRDEVILIKGYDSLTDGRARLSLHTAFDDPTTPANAPARDSIEVRHLVFF